MTSLWTQLSGEHKSLFGVAVTTSADTNAIFQVCDSAWLPNLLPPEHTFKEFEQVPDVHGATQSAQDIKGQVLQVLLRVCTIEATRRNHQLLPFLHELLHS